MAKGISLLTIRPDLSLQIALGDEVMDLDLGPSNAYVVASELAQKLRDIRAQVGGDGDLVVIAYDQALAALAAAQILSRPDVKISAENQSLAAKVIRHGNYGLALLREEIQLSTTEATDAAKPS